jgi:hypothetical protein
VVVTQTYADLRGPPRQRVADKASHGLFRPGAADYDELNGGGGMAKYHSRPSAQYRYEHYDPR